MKKARIRLYAFVIASVVWSLIPIYYIINISAEYYREISHFPPYLIAPNPSLVNYFRLFGQTVQTPFGLIRPTGHSQYFITGIENSMIVAMFVMMLTMLIATPAGYAFGRMRFPGKDAMFFVLLFSRCAPPVSTVIPYYMFYRAAGLLGTQAGIVLVHLTITIPLITWVLMGFFRTLPIETERAARIDGCTRFQAFRKVLIFMAMPGIATCGILAFLTSWNEFLFAWIVATGTPAQTLPPVLLGYIVGGAEFYPEVMAAADTVAIIPALITGALLQKYIKRLNLVDPITYR